LLQTRRREELHSALAPFAKLGHHVIRNKDHLRRPADEGVLLGIWFRRDQREYCAAVGGSYSDPALAGTEADIADQIESQLVDVESQALVLIANKDVDRVNAKIRAAFRRAKAPAGQSKGVWKSRPWSRL